LVASVSGITKEKTEDLGESVGALDELGEDVDRFASTIHAKIKVDSKKKQQQPKHKHKKTERSTAMPRMTARGQIDYVASKMAESEANLKHLDEASPKIIQDQITADREKYGARLTLLEGHYAKLQSRFANIAADVSPRLKTQQAIEDAVNDEYSKKQDYTHGLDSISVYAKSVDQEVSAATAYAGDP